MELRHLRYFITVAEHKSIRLASHYLHVTQPAISRQIQDLETEVGVKLFIRHPRGLTLTLAGEAFYRDIKKNARWTGSFCRTGAAHRQRF
ncbi:TPA: LysR family transcriptional regulator [Enterobacter cloacae]